MKSRESVTAKGSNPVDASIESPATREDRNESLVSFRVGRIRRSRGGGVRYLREEGN